MSSNTDNESGDEPVGIDASLIKAHRSVAGGTDQLGDRTIGTTIGDGLQPPYDPALLAGFQELNGTHAICIQKKAKREVGFGFEIVPHERVDPDDASESERERVEDFWRGRDNVWKVGPRRRSTTPTECFEQGRQDYHGIGWMALEIMYANYDDDPAGLATVPAKTVRVSKNDDEDEGQMVGHGYVQKMDGRTVHYAEAGDRHATDVTGDPDPTYVDKETGETYDSPEALKADGGEPANELLFITNPHPQSLYYGIPTWVAEIPTMIADQEARRFNRERLANDLILDYVVTVEGAKLTDESRDNINKHIQGMRDSDEPASLILESEELTQQLYGEEESPSINVEQMAEWGEQDMSFIEFQNENEHDIAQVHEVPLQLLGHQDATNSNTEESIREFTNEVIKPEQERLAGRIYHIIHQQILDVQDWTIEFTSKGAKNEREDAEVAQIRVNGSAGTATVDEAREEFGREPLGEPVGEMLLAELGGSGSTGGDIGEQVGDVVDDEVEQAINDLRQDLQTEQWATGAITADD